jgi:hypothetical protein
VHAATANTNPIPIFANLFRNIIRLLFGPRIH